MPNASGWSVHGAIVGVHDQRPPPQMVPAMCLLDELGAHCLIRDYAPPKP